MKSTLMKLTIVTALAIPPSAFADDDRPYYGSDQQPCKVNKPSGKYKKLDMGYLTNKDCTKVFVSPPSDFKIKVIEQNASPVAKELCHQYNSILKIDDWKKKNQVMKEFKSQNSGNYFESTLLVDFSYQGLIEAYRDANPDLNATFHATPQDVKILSISNTSDGLGYQNAIVRKNLTRALPYTVKMNIPGRDQPLTIEESDFNAVINDESVEIALKFGLDLTCRILEGSTKPANLFSGTMTYFYHQTTNSYIKFNVQAEALSQKINELIQTTPKFKFDDLHHILDQVISLNVEMNSGFSDRKITYLDVMEASNTLVKQLTKVALDQLLLDGNLVMSVDPLSGQSINLNVKNTEVNLSILNKLLDQHLKTTASQFTEYHPFAQFDTRAVL